MLPQENRDDMCNKRQGLVLSLGGESRPPMSIELQLRFVAINIPLPGEGSTMVG